MWLEHASWPNSACHHCGLTTLHILTALHLVSSHQFFFFFNPPPCTYIALSGPMYTHIARPYVHTYCQALCTRIGIARSCAHTYCQALCTHILSGPMYTHIVRPYVHTYCQTLCTHILPGPMYTHIARKQDSQWSDRWSFLTSGLSFVLSNLYFTVK